MLKSNTETQPKEKNSKNRHKSQRLTVLIVRSSKKIAKGSSTYAEDLMPWAYCVSLCELICSCLVDSEGHIFLVFSIHSGSHNISAPFSEGYPELWGERFEGDLQFTLSLHVRLGCGCLYLFPSAARGSLFDDNQIGHWSVSISLGVISLILFYNTPVSSVWFYFGLFLVSGLSSLWFLGTQAVSGVGTFSGGELYTESDIDCLLP